MARGSNTGRGAHSSSVTLPGTGTVPRASNGTGTETNTATVCPAPAPAAVLQAMHNLGTKNSSPGRSTSPSRADAATSQTADQPSAVQQLAIVNLSSRGKTLTSGLILDGGASDKASSATLKRRTRRNRQKAREAPCQSSALEGDVDDIVHVVDLPPALDLQDSQEAEIKSTANTCSQDAEIKITANTCSQDSVIKSTVDTCSQDAAIKSTVETSSQDTAFKITVDTSSQDAEIRSQVNTSSQDAAIKITANTCSQDAAIKSSSDTSSQDAAIKSTSNTFSQNAAIKSTADACSQDADTKSTANTSSVTSARVVSNPDTVATSICSMVVGEAIKNLKVKLNAGFPVTSAHVASNPGIAATSICSMAVGEAIKNLSAGFPATSAAAPATSATSAMQKGNRESDILAAPATGEALTERGDLKQIQITLLADEPVPPASSATGGALKGKKDLRQIQSTPRASEPIPPADLRQIQSTLLASEPVPPASSATDGALKEKGDFSLIKSTPLASEPIPPAASATGEALTERGDLSQIQSTPRANEQMAAALSIKSKALKEKEDISLTQSIPLPRGPLSFEHLFQDPSSITFPRIGSLSCGPGTQPHKTGQSGETFDSANHPAMHPSDIPLELPASHEYASEFQHSVNLTRTSSMTVNWLALKQENISDTLSRPDARPHGPLGRRFDSISDTLSRPDSISDTLSRPDLPSGTLGGIPHSTKSHHTYVSVHHSSVHHLAVNRAAGGQRGGDPKVTISLGVPSVWTEIKVVNMDFYSALKTLKHENGAVQAAQDKKQSLPPKKQYTWYHGLLGESEGGSGRTGAEGGKPEGGPTGTGVSEPSKGLRSALSSVQHVGFSWLKNSPPKGADGEAIAAIAAIVGSSKNAAPKPQMFPMSTLSRTESSSQWAIMMEQGCRSFEAVILREGLNNRLLCDYLEAEGLPLPPFNASACIHLASNCAVVKDRLPIMIIRKLVTAREDFLKASKLPSMLMRGSQRLLECLEKLDPEIESQLLFFDFLIEDISAAIQAAQAVQALQKQP
eukprot:gene5081-34879_t